MSFKSILNSLSNDPNLRTLTRDEEKRLKAILLDSYLDIQSFCLDHGLSIMLVGGSALGAVRHKGFIPWDDDMDIAMPRSDYETFKQLFYDGLGDKYKLDAPNTGVKASNRFPKILIKNTKLVELGTDPQNENANIKIDLFVIENVPDNRIVRFAHGFLCTAAMFIAGQTSFYEEQDDRFKEYMYKTREGRNAYNRRRIIGKIFSFRPAYKWFNTVDKLCHYNRATRMLGIPTGRKHYFGEVLPKEAFLPVSIGLFEQNAVCLPGNTDMYLSNLFGNYMEIPEENKRERHFIYEIEFPE